MQAHAAAVAALMTFRAAFAVIEQKVFVVRNSQLGKKRFAVAVGQGVVFLLGRMIRFFAMAAQGPRQALRQHA